MNKGRPKSAHALRPYLDLLCIITYLKVYVFKMISLSGTLTSAGEKHEDRMRALVGTCSNTKFICEKRIKMKIS
jgi:hypothetical protein